MGAPDPTFPLLFYENFAFRFSAILSRIPFSLPISHPVPSKGVSNQVGPFLNVPPTTFLPIGLTVEINLTVKKLFKIAIRMTSRTAGLAVCKSSI